MFDQVLMNDEAARSPSGEILDQATQAQTTEKKTDSQQATDTTSSQEGSQKSTDTAAQSTDKTTDPTEKKTDAPQGAPEKYADFKAPEGVTLDPKLVEAALPVFKELGLTQDQAQKLVDQQAKLMADATKAPLEAVRTMRDGWKTATLADADIRGAVDKDSGKTGLDAVKVDVARALNALGDPKLASDFAQAMDLTGAGDHPAFVKTFWKLSQFVTEGKHVAGRNPSPEGQRNPATPAKPAPAQAMYPSLPSANAR